MICAFKGTTKLNYSRFPYIKKQFARLQRKNSTPAEQKVWDILRNRKFNNLKFRRQHNFNGFIIDFYCDELRLAIEIDGGIHVRQKEYDHLRQKLIENHGILFIRVTNKNIMDDMNILLDTIMNMV